MERSNSYKDGLLFTAMVVAECTNVGLNILFKLATNKGMSYFVFIFYSSATATLVLLLFPFIFRSSLLRILGYTGIAYSSPTLASMISNLTPGFTFTLAIIFRMEKLALRSLGTWAKIIGTVVSVSGAMLVVLYKGPTIISPSSTALQSLQWPLQSTQSKWVMGGLLLLMENLLISVWYIIQAFFGLTFSTVVHTFGLHMKGPVYTAIFKPLSVAIAAIMSFIFLGESLHLGSVIGGVIICVGFYVVIWGKANDEEGENEDSSKISLLQSP
ncbi:WAT1-related protein [Citrus sinensis]|nr:WAT1-related protein [Citrus sinensis]